MITNYLFFLITLSKEELTKQLLIILLFFVFIILIYIFLKYIKIKFTNKNSNSLFQKFLKRL